MELVKATLTCLESFDEVPVLWNPEAYRVERSNRFAAPATIGARPRPSHVVGGEERFSARLLVDTSREPPGRRDARAWAARVDSWTRPDAETGLPPRVLFAWGDFRFRGWLESLVAEWVWFDSDGTARRGWLDIILRA